MVVSCLHQGLWEGWDPSVPGGAQAGRGLLKQDVTLCGLLKQDLTLITLKHSASQIDPATGSKRHKEFYPRRYRGGS